MKNVRDFVSEKFQFLEVKFYIYLNRRVFVMLIGAHGRGFLTLWLKCFCLMTRIVLFPFLDNSDLYWERNEPQHQKTYLRTCTI